MTLGATVARSQLFGRVARLAVADRSRAPEQGTEFEGFRMVFDVEKTSSRSPNPLRLQIFNVADAQSRAVFTRGARLRLSAGYLDSESILFLGEVDTVEHYRDGADSITELTARDGSAAFEAYLSRQWGAGASWRTIVREVASAMGLQISDATLARIEGAPAYGLAAEGLAYRELDTIARSLSMSWTIDAGEIVAIPIGEAGSRLVVDVNAGTGMIGTPARIEPTRRLRRQRAAFAVAMNPRLRAGSLVRIASSRVNGLHRVDRATHVGDTHGDQWITECEATEVPA